MPSFIRHRVNSVAEVRSLKPDSGAEIDLRSSVSTPGKILLSHDPWVVGDSFEEWLRVFAAEARGPLILNTKEDALESRALELLQAAGVRNYFFLDMTTPTLVRRCLKEGMRNFAVRVSKHEPAAGIAAFRGKADWAWLDCFDGDPLPLETAEGLRGDFRMCLVSPELQVPGFLDFSLFKELAVRCDAICTKRPEAWMALL